MICLIAAVLIHEVSHTWAAKVFGIRAQSLRLLPFGAEVEIECAFLPASKKILILLAGSFGNIVVALVCSSFLWLFPTTFMFLSYFIVANAIPAVLNLLPIYPLDGGKVLHLLAEDAKSGKRKVENGKFMKKIKFPFMLQVFSTVVFTGLLVYGCFWGFNVALILFSAAMIFCTNIEMKKTRFVSTLHKGVKINKNRIREVAVRSDMKLFEVYKLVSPKFYAKFIITDKGNRGFYEDSLERLLLEHSLDTRVGDVAF